MDNSVLRKTIFDLKRESLDRGGSVTYTIAGNSMLFLFSMNDEVVVRKAGAEELSIGDIILYSSQGAAGTVEVVHRIVRRAGSPAGVRFKTKGDFNLLPDPGWVEPKNVIGKICVLRKRTPGLRIPLDRGAGRLLSLVAGVFSSLFALPWYPFRKAGTYAGRRLRSLAPEPPCTFDPAFLLKNSAFGVDNEGWLECVRAFERVAVAPGLQAGDIQIGGGFSEEACSLRRRGVSVIPLPLAPDEPSANEGALDLLIAARVIDLLPGESDRLRFLRRSAALLKPGGLLTVSWLRSSCVPGPGGLVKMKRRLYSALPGGRYKGPGPGAVTAGKRFIRQELPGRTTAAEIREAGFDVRDSMAGKQMCFIVARKR